MRHLSHLPSAASLPRRVSASLPESMLSAPLLAVLAMVLVAFGIPGSLAAQPDFGFGGPGGNEPEVSTSVAAPDGFGRAGETINIAFSFVMAETWHIQAGLESGEVKGAYRATETNATALPDGWSAGKAMWPESHEFQIGQGEYAEVIRGYDGVIVSALPITIPADTAPGSYELAFEVKTQACDDTTCLAPETTELSLTLTVVGAGDAAPENAVGLSKTFRDTLEETLANNAAPEVTFEDGQRVIAESAWYEGALLPGRDATLGIIFNVESDWHIQLAAASGLVPDGFIETELEVTLPDGFTAGDFVWPAVTADAAGDFYYRGRHLIAIPISVSEDTPAGEYEIAATLSYQACDDVDKLCEMPTSLTISVKAVVTDAATAANPETAPVEPISNEVAGLFRSTLSAGGMDTGDVDGVKKTDNTELKTTIKNAKWWLSFAFVVIAMGWMAIGGLKATRRPAILALLFITAAGVIYGTFSFVRGVTSESRVTWVKYTPAAFDEASSRGDIIFMKFTADWCANCIVNERIIVGNDTAVDELNRADVTAFKVDFSGENPDGDAKKLELGGGGIPLIAVYHPDREEPLKIRGQIATADPVIRGLRGTFEEVAVDENAWVFDIFGVQFSVPKSAFLLIFAIAFVAGFLMNFTPCVLPVIPIKILSLQAHAKEPARCLYLGNRLRARNHRALCSHRIDDGRSQRIN